MGKLRRRRICAAALVAFAVSVGGCGADGDGATGNETPDGGEAGRQNPVEGPPEPSPLGLTHQGRVIELLPGSVEEDPFLTGPGLAGVEVCVHEHDDVPCVSSDEDGTYTLAGLPTDSELTLTFHKDGYFPMARPLFLQDASVHLAGELGSIAADTPIASHPMPMLLIDSLCPGGGCSFLDVHGAAGAADPNRGSVFLLAGNGAGVAVATGSVAASYTGAAPSYALDPALTATVSGGRALFANLEPGVAVIDFDGENWSCGSWLGGSVNALPADSGSIRVPVLAGHTTLSAPRCTANLAVCGGVTCEPNPLNLPSCCTTEDTGKALLCDGCGLTPGVCGVHLTFIPAMADRCFQLDLPGELDATCPGYETQFGFREGCCTEEGFCGGLEPAIPLGCMYQPNPTGGVIRGAPCGPQPGFTCGDESCSTKPFQTPPCCTADGTGVPGDPLEFAGTEAGRCGTLVDGVCLQTSLPGVVNETCPVVEADGSSRPGCCTDEGFCGSVDPLGRGCIYLPSVGKGDPCTNG